MRLDAASAQREQGANDNTEKSRSVPEGSERHFSILCLFSKSEAKWERNTEKSRSVSEGSERDFSALRLFGESEARMGRHREIARV